MADDDIDPGELELFRQLNEIEEKIGRPIPEAVRVEVARRYDEHRRLVRRLTKNCRINVAAAVIGIVSLVDCFFLTRAWMRLLFSLAQAVAISINAGLWGMNRERLRNLPDGIVLQEMPGEGME